MALRPHENPHAILGAFIPIPVLRVGIIGCGRIAREVHLPVLARHAMVRIAALADPDESRLSQARQLTPAAVAFRDFRDLVANDSLDAVVVCAPTGLHAGIARAVLDRGLHLYLEKPIAASIEEAEPLLESWRRQGKVAMVGFNYRFHPLFQSAREVIDSGKLGALLAVRSVFSTWIEDLRAWKTTRATGGGVLLDLASHHVDLIHYLFGQDVAEASAQVRSGRAEADTASVELRLQNGLLVQSFFSLSSVEEDQLEIYGEAGRLRVDRYLSVDCEVRSREGARSRLGQIAAALNFVRRPVYLARKMRAAGHEPSYAAALDHFIGAIRNGTPASPDLLDGYRSLLVIEAAEQSARTGMRVPVRSLRSTGAAV